MKSENPIHTPNPEPDSPFAYLHDRTDEEKAYLGRLDRWLKKTFENLSSAPRNDPPWFEKRICNTFRQFTKETNGPVLIGLTGHAGTGKDSATEFIRHVYEFYCGFLAFAGPLKQIAKIVGFTNEQLTDRKLKEIPDEFWGISPRQFLQMCGTEMFRNVWRDDAWVQITKCRIKSLSEMKVEVGSPVFGGRQPTDFMHAIFVTDVRFPNEAAMIKEQGGIVVRISRPDNPLAIAAQHASESQIDDIAVDLTVVNNCPTAEEWSWKFAKELTQFLDSKAFYV